MPFAPPLRVRALNSKPLNSQGNYVLYWMVAFRRPTYNFALDHAVAWAQKLRKPLVILEPLRCDYEWANDRLHFFVVQGMAHHAEVFAQNPVTYYPYVEPQKGAGKDLLETFAREACTVITDDYPGFFHPHMQARAAEKLSVQMESVDSNGLLPLRATEQTFPTAYAFRRFLQKSLRPHLEVFPQKNSLENLKLPLLDTLSAEIKTRWPATDVQKLALDPTGLASFPINHLVKPVDFVGGHAAARQRLQLFVTRKLKAYPEKRNEPEEDGSSKLSPYLHFGHTSTHEIFDALAELEGWKVTQLTQQTSGQRHGYWGLPEYAEAFIDELVTWRELGFNMASKRSDYREFESLPTWAQDTLKAHENDNRPHAVSLDVLEKAQTHDRLWNAAMMQLKTEGWFHNYLRMLWGKKILEYTRSPKEALQVMEYLMNTYSLDGRGPNAYSGYFWVLGRYDRPWGPERTIFGKIRYMSSDNTARKFSVENYIEQYTGKSPTQAKLF